MVGRVRFDRGLGRSLFGVRFRGRATVKSPSTLDFLQLCCRLRLWARTSAGIFGKAGCAFSDRIVCVAWALGAARSTRARRPQPYACVVKHYSAFGARGCFLCRRSAMELDSRAGQPASTRIGSRSLQRNGCTLAVCDVGGEPPVSLARGLVVRPGVHHRSPLRELTQAIADCVLLIWEVEQLVEVARQVGSFTFVPTCDRASANLSILMYWGRFLGTIVLPRVGPDILFLPGSYCVHAHYPAKLQVKGLESHSPVLFHRELVALERRPTAEAGADREPCACDDGRLARPAPDDTRHTLNMFCGCAFLLRGRPLPARTCFSSVRWPIVASWAE